MQLLPKYNKRQALSQRIKDALFIRGITQSQFSEQMGVSDSVISRLLSGKHNPTINTLFKVEIILDTQIIVIT